MNCRFLKMLTCSTFMLSSFAFAQSGLLGGSDGIHQHNANTMGARHFKIGTGGDIATDNWGYTRAGKFVDPNGNTQQFDVWDANMEEGRIDGALAGNFNVSYGVTDFWDVGVSLPIYYDHAKDYSGEAIRAGMVQGGLGDLEIWTKHQFAQFHDDDIWTLAAEANLTIPTGWKNAGLRPRHAWFLNGNGGNTYAYTADAFMIGIHGVITVDYTKKGLPLIWNSNLGYMVALGDASNTLVYGTGINYLAQSWLDVFLEFSGEMRLGNNDYPISPITDPMLLTPGVRLHLPWNFEFSAGLDIGVRNLTNIGYDVDDEMDGCDDFMLQYDDGNGNKSHYCYSSGPLFAATATLTWRFGGEDYKDTDGDGVRDNIDQCPHTPKGAIVDSVGCPMDTDEDGVIDGFDKCPDTPKGATVDSVGCHHDSDKDKVADGIDQCPNTLQGVEVDTVGCPLQKKQDLNLLKKGINFEFGSAKLTTASYPTLDDIVALMKEFPDANLEVQGHTDIVGTEEYNQKLSEDRAHSVTDYLQSKGIDSTRLRAKGFGTKMPIADNETDEGRAKNRRVELIPFYKEDQTAEQIAPQAAPQTAPQAAPKAEQK